MGTRPSRHSFSNSLTHLCSLLLLLLHIVSGIFLLLFLFTYFRCFLTSIRRTFLLFLSLLLLLVLLDRRSPFPTLSLLCLNL